MSLAARLLMESPLGRFLSPRYAFNFTPDQLAFLCHCLDDVRDVRGCIVEAGCFRGQTTVFLNAHMDASKADRLYYALDTFEGFVPSQVEHEVSKRGKRSRFRGFSVNSQRQFRRTMKMHNAGRVRSLKCDVAAFDFDSIAPIAFCLLDVDLYLPTKAAIPRILRAMSPGGILVVDDCKPDNIFDGAHQAFTEAGGTEIQLGKLGVIRQS